MEIKREPFQGVLNIIQFNWHFYAIALAMVFVLGITSVFCPNPFNFLLFWLAFLIGITTFNSLIVSFFVYDYSKLYDFNWLNFKQKTILNINAGFDETTEILKTKFPESKITSCDFYDENKHTEISIKRARKKYPTKHLVQVSTTNLAFPDNSFDNTVAFFSVHEIRDAKERLLFLNELSRVTKGEIYITEHLRDWKNFLAYSIGFMHFHSKKSWLKTFEKSNLNLEDEIKTTAFVSTFILRKNGN